MDSEASNSENFESSRDIQRNRDNNVDKSCMVCNAPTSGFHFGSFACAACSAFFRRTIVEKRKYVCRKDNNCPIDQQHRCYCRACRLKKCLDKGLDPNAVQPHRDAIGAKQLTMNQKSEPNRNNSEEKKNEKERDTVITVTQNDERLVPVIVVKPRTDKQIIEDQLNSILARQEKSEELKKSESNKAAIEQLIAFSKVAVIECNNKQSTLDRNISPTESPNSVLSSDNAQNILEASNSIEASTSSESSPMVINDKKTYDRTQNVIEMMVDAYQAMCERRRLVYCPRSLKDLLSGTQPVPRSCKWGERFSPEQMRIEVAFMVEFINSIHPFAKFSLNDRMELFRNIALACVMLEKHYLTMKLGGISQSRLYHQDHSYSDLNDEDALVPKHDVSCDMDTLRKLFLEPARSSLKLIASSMEQNQMTDVELCALVAVMLFDPTIRSLDASSKKLVMAARDKVYADWFSYYANRDIPVDVASEKVGNTMLLLPAIQSTVERSHENFTIIRVFDLLNYDKILDDVV